MVLPPHFRRFMNLYFKYNWSQDLALARELVNQTIRNDCSGRIPPYCKCFRSKSNYSRVHSLSEESNNLHWPVSKPNDTIIEMKTQFKKFLVPATRSEELGSWNVESHNSYRPIRSHIQWGMLEEELVLPIDRIEDSS
jgi:hypothetical protein